MNLIVWIINDIHMEFNDIHWEGCLQHNETYYAHVVIRNVLAVLKETDTDRYDEVEHYFTAFYCLLRNCPSLPHR